MTATRSAELIEQTSARLCRQHLAGVAAVEIAEQRGVSRRTIDQILSGRSYPHVPRPEGMATGRRDARGSGHPNAVLTPGRVRKIRRLSAEGMSGRAIAAKIGCAPGTVKRVLRGETWRNVADKPQV